MPFNESSVELFALEQLSHLGYGIATGNRIDEGDREEYTQVILEGRLREAMQRLNPGLPESAYADALTKVRQAVDVAATDLIAANLTLHKLMTEGVKVSYMDGPQERPAEMRLIDFDDAGANDFLAVNQFTVQQGRQVKRPDILVFVNGLPVVVFELKNPGAERATLERAHNQVLTYQSTVSRLFAANAFNVISDGSRARAGTISADRERYAAWKSLDGKTEVSRLMPQLEVLIRGMMPKAVLLDLIKSFITFEDTTQRTKQGTTEQVKVKKLAAYHQYYAVNKAVASTLEASGLAGDRRGGVVWHTQGSGKSLSMVFYTGKLVQAPAMRNPTVVVITDRNDLDNQLYGTFTASSQLLRQKPVQAESRDHLRELLRVAQGGIVFTTIHKFAPEAGKPGAGALTERANVVVIADEAHRSQYGFESRLVDAKDETGAVVGKDIRYGLAHYMQEALPNATYLGFTGTPIETKDKSTRLVFGDYIDIYDIARAVEDGSTVKIYYESRLAKINLSEEGRALVAELDKELEQDENATETQRYKARETQLTAIVGHPERIRTLAADLVEHFEQRTEALAGKGMVVAISREVAARLYDAVVAIRPGWHSGDLTKGAIKVVMTSTSDDGPEIARHKTSKEDRELLAIRMRDPEDPLKLVIVRDMWLTGFDAPCLHTLYIDKPMQGHNLMQAIARVNRVFKDKPGGLVVDYLGISADLKKALKFYSESGGKGEPAETQAQAVEVLKEKLDVVRNLFTERSRNQSAITAHEPAAYYGNGAAPSNTGFDYSRFFKATTQERMGILLQANEHLLGLERGKERFVREVSLLSQAFALSVPHPEALAAKEEVAFYQYLKATLTKFDEPLAGTGKSATKGRDYASLIRQIVDDSLEAEDVVDIFQAAGMERPEISILSDEFLKEVKGLTYKNLALELLKKLLNDEIRTSQRGNAVKSQELLKMLESSLRRYQNKLLTTAEVIQELIDLAKHVKTEQHRGTQKQLTPEELAFYDALRDNDTVREVMDDARLIFIAREVTEQVRRSTTLDWNARSSARAQVEVAVKRTLRKHGYPPEKQDQAVKLVLEQATLMAEILTN